MVTETITSDSVVSIPQGADKYSDACVELLGFEEFKKIIIYRRFDFDADNITGDIDKSSFTDYTIYGELQPAEINDNLVKIGELQIGDVEVFLPARVNTNTSGDAITEFRPQIHDEITFQGIRYKIDKLQFESHGTSEVSVYCMCKRVDNSNAIGWS